MTDGKKWLGSALVIVGLVVVGLLGVSYPVPEMPEARATRYGTVDSLRVMHLLNVQGAADLDSTLNVDGATTLDAVTLAGALDMGNYTISNIGAAGTDFGSDGSLTTAQTITVTAGGLVVSAGGANVTGSIDGSADIDLGTWLNLSAQSVIALSDGGIITPTGTYQIITSTAEVTTSTSIAIWDGSEAGNLLILRNGNAADVINIDGTGGNVECKANVALGASDTLSLIWNGSDWNCVSSYDNS